MFLSTACAVRVYWALSSRSSVFVAWMFPDLSSITKMIPAPSPERMYLIFPSPESISECSCKMKNRYILTGWYTFCVPVHENKSLWYYYNFTSFKNLAFHQAIIHIRAHAVNTSTLHSEQMPAETCMLLPHLGCYWDPSLKISGREYIRR